MMAEWRSKRRMLMEMEVHFETGRPKTKVGTTKDLEDLAQQIFGASLRLSRRKAFVCFASYCCRAASTRTAFVEDEAASRAHSEAGNPAVFPPIPSPQRLFEELHLNRDFLLEPSVEQLT